MRAGLESGLLHLHHRPRRGGACGADFVFLCVPTPPGADGAADLRFVEQASAEIAPASASPEPVVVTKSTVPVGSKRAKSWPLSAASDTAWFSSNRSSSGEGQRGARPAAPGPGRHRQRASASRPPARSWPGCTSPLGAPVQIHHRSRLVGDDQVRLQCVPGRQGVLRQRHRQSSAPPSVQTRWT